MCYLLKFSFLYITSGDEFILKLPLKIYLIQVERRFDILSKENKSFNKLIFYMWKSAAKVNLHEYEIQINDNFVISYSNLLNYINVSLYLH